MIKETDVCLIYMKDLPAGFVRVDSIEPDEKPGWFEVSFIELKIPIQGFKWKLEERHLKGDTIHMNGQSFRLQVLESTKEVIPERPVKKDIDGNIIPHKPAKVISMADFKESRKVREIPKELA